MPVKRRLAKVRAHRITEQAIDAFRAGDFLRLHLALELRPWHQSPLDVDENDDTPIPPGGNLWETTRPMIQDIRRAILAILAALEADRPAAGPGRRDRSARA